MAASTMTDTSQLGPVSPAWSGLTKLSRVGGRGMMLVAMMTN